MSSARFTTSNTWLLQVVLGLLLGFFAKLFLSKYRHKYCLVKYVYDDGIGNKYDTIYLLEI